MIFMRFNEWITFIKESRDWHTNKCYSISCCLIEKCDNDNDEVIDIITMNLLWYLYDDFVKTLLSFQASI